MSLSAAVRAPPHANARRASFSSCYFPQINVAPALIPHQLNQLDHFDVGISKKAMEHLLRSCTALEYLRLPQIHGFISLHIASTNLRWIYVSCWPCNKTSIGKRPLQLFHVMVIENAPFLERLLVSDLEGPTKIRVIDAHSVGALVCQILRTLYWICNRSGTTLIFFSVFLKFTFLNFFLMYLRPSSRK